MDAPSAFMPSLTWVKKSSRTGGGRGSGVGSARWVGWWFVLHASLVWSVEVGGCQAGRRRRPAVRRALPGPAGSQRSARDAEPPSPSLQLATPSPRRAPAAARPRALPTFVKTSLAPRRK
jgi:hypothetical protein